jgi:hypothetical protein
MVEYIAIINDYHEVWNMPCGGMYPIIFSANNKKEAIQITEEICNEKIRSILEIKGVSSNIQISCLEILTLSEFNLIQ